MEPATDLHRHPAVNLADLRARIVAEGLAPDEVIPKTGGMTRLDLLAEAEEILAQNNRTYSEAEMRAEFPDLFPEAR